MLAGLLARVRHRSFYLAVMNGQTERQQTAHCLDLSVSVMNVIGIAICRLCT